MIFSSRILPLHVLAVLFLLAGSALAETVSERLDRFRAETMTPGVAVAVLRSGEDTPQLFVSGLANVETGTPVTADSVFRIGSVTKVFTAALTLRLVERGILSLDMTLERLVPELPDASRITVRDLLRHSSGLPEFMRMTSFNTSMARAWSVQELLDLIARAPLDFPPGRRFSYSNSNYLVLGLLIERAGGHPYAEALAEEIVRPLAMSKTGLGDDRTLVPNSVAGYDIDGTGAEPRLIHAAWISIEPPGASGGVLSRPADFVRLARLDHLLSPETVRLMQTPNQVLEGTGPRLPAKDGQPAISIDYGLGFELVRVGTATRPMISKLGVIPGFANWLVLFPEQGLALAASANNEQVVMPLLLMLDEIASSQIARP